MKLTRLPNGLRETLQCACSRRPITLGRQRALNVRPKPIQFSTACRLRDSIAAPEIKFPQRRGDGEEEDFYARVVPVSSSYFSSQPNFTDNLLSLQQLLAKYYTLPTAAPGEQPRVAWRTLAQYRETVGEVVKAAKYHQILSILARLNQIHPSLMPSEVQDALHHYKKDINPYKNVMKVTPIDKLGRSLGVGRRKASSARAWVVEGTGEVLINGKTLVEAFGRVHDRESAIWALKATNRIDKYNVWALVTGGGTTGQAEALALAVSKALMGHEPALKPALRRAGCVTRDPRRVERKKPGKVKARKMPAWVKR